TLRPRPDPSRARLPAVARRDDGAAGVVRAEPPANGRTTMSTPRRSDGVAGPADGEQSMVEVTVQRVGDDRASRGRALLAVEEPLEIRLVYGPARHRVRRSITVTMRTPGRDVELAAGFLFAEGVVCCREDIEHAVSCGPPAGPLGVRNLVRVELAPDLGIDEKRLQRDFLTTSSCGLCGKASLH